MGWVNERRTQAGKRRFTAMYRDITAASRSAGTYTTLRAAERAWQRAELDQSAGRGRAGDVRRGQQTLRSYVEDDWLPNHVMEATTRETYTYLLNRYILPALGGMRLGEMLPGHVREWVTALSDIQGARPPTIRKCKVILDAILTTALNDRLVVLHAGQGVRTPPVPAKPRPVITVEQFERLLAAVPDGTMRLLVETDIETGLRWGELTELRVKDLDLFTGILTVQRVVVHLRAAAAGGSSFLVKEYPKDRHARRLRVAPHIVEKLRAHITLRGLDREDLLFAMDTVPDAGSASTAELREPNVAVPGMTDPDERGRRYRHGSLSAYTNVRCRCPDCRGALAAYRAERRARGKDDPRGQRTVATDGHIGNDWFRNNVWRQAVADAEIEFSVTPHDLRHAHASWLLAGGADIQVVKERLGHGSITTTERYLRALPGANDAALAALALFRRT